MSTDSEKSNFRILWLVLAAGAVSLLGGGALFIMNQTVGTGASGHLGPGRLEATYAAGDGVDIWRNESWLPGEVVEVDDERYRVEYERAETFPSEWVDASRLRASR